MARLTSLGRTCTEDDLRPLLQEFVAGLKADYTLNTVALQLTRARKEITARFGARHPAYRLLLSGAAAARLGGSSVGLTMLETDVRRRQARLRVSSYLRAQIALPISQIRALLAQACALITTEAVFEHPSHSSFGRLRWDLILAGLLLLTGRRPIELLCLGHFEAAEADHLLFSGQAKTRDAACARNSPYTIPVLAPPGQVLTAIDRLRQHAPSLQVAVRRDKLAESVHNLYKNDLGHAIRSHFSPWKAQDLRPIYGLISYHRFAPENMAFSPWLADVLGHSLISAATPNQHARQADTLTTAYYERYYIPDLARNQRLSF